MDPWLWLVLPLLLPVVLAALPARTERWRRARTRLRLALLLGGALSAAFTVINPLGPAAVTWAALLLFAAVTGMGFHAMGIIGEEQRAWRRRPRRPADEPNLVNPPLE